MNEKIYEKVKYKKDKQYIFNLIELNFALSLVNVRKEKVVLLKININLGYV